MILKGIIRGSENEPEHVGSYTVLWESSPMFVFSTVNNKLLLRQTVNCDTEKGSSHSREEPLKHVLFCWYFDFCGLSLV